MTRFGRRNHNEDGYVAVVVAILFSTVLLAAAAIGVDVARWFVEAERVQTAADSAALAGVVFLPDNLPRATEAALANAELNGYEDGDNAEVTVTVGERRSQLHVQIATDVTNQFGKAIGIDETTIGRSATADYTSPAPMGSPCNTFGNEPLGGSDNNSGPAANQSRCNTRPNFWAAIEGPNMDKVSGDRYSTTRCGPSPEYLPTFACANGLNSEGTTSEQGHPEGYFFAVKIGQGLVGKAVRLQIFDPVYYATGTACTSNLPSIGGSTSNTLNKYTDDARTRYLGGTGETRPFCTGDTSQGSNPTVTSFALREATDEQDPMQGAGVTGCPPVQFLGFATRRGNNASGTTGVLTSSNNSGTAANRYNDGFAKTFRQWVDMCTFYPTRTGNYFIQVRTNVDLGGTPEPNTNGHDPVIYRGNSSVLLPTGPRTAGDGANAFALRAIADPSDQVSVSGWARMPMLQNNPDSEAEFHMLRVLPAAAGQSISFQFFDAADISRDASGTVTVLPPADATGTITSGLTGCTEAKNATVDFEPVDSDNCAVQVSNDDNNGQLHKMRIPIPADYSCTDTQSGCWFKIRIDMTGAESITDFTTWDASLEGDPVRLVE